MPINLNLNDFRAMIGNNSYGEVRIREGGGLEKINNNFLQRTIGFGMIKPDRAENLFIRNSFVTALMKDGVPKETLDEIRIGLGLSTETQAGQASIAEKPLARRDIRDFIKMADDAKVEQKMAELRRSNDNNQAAMGLLMGSLLTRDVANLKSRIETYNQGKTEQGQKIILSSTEIKILFERHLAEMTDLLKAAGTGKNREQVFMEKLKAFVDRKNLKEGGCSFTSSVKDNRNFGDEADPWLAKTSRMRAVISSFHLWNDHPFRLKDEADAHETSKTMHLGKDDFVLYSRKEELEAKLKTRVDANELYKFAQKHELSGLPHKDQLVIYCACKSATNFIRNSPIFRIKYRNFDYTADFTPAVKHGSLEMAVQTMVDALKEARREIKEMTDDQFLCLAFAFDSAHMMPGSVGMSGYENDGTTVTITFARDNLNVKCEARGRILTQEQKMTLRQEGTVDEPQRVFAAEYGVNPDGLARFKYVNVGEAQG